MSTKKIKIDDMIEDMVSTILLADHLTYDNANLKKKLNQAKAVNTRLTNKIEELERKISQDQVFEFSREEAFLLNRFKATHLESCKCTNFDYASTILPSGDRDIRIHCPVCSDLFIIPTEITKWSNERAAALIYSALDTITGKYYEHDMSDEDDEDDGD